MAVLAVDQLAKRFGGLDAVAGVSLVAEEGEVVGLIGPNGAGKTTLVNLLSGALLPTAGRILYRGRDVTRLSAHERCRLGLARTFQIPRPFFDMTIRENVMVGALFGRGGGVRGGMAEARRRAEAAMLQAGLGAMGEGRTAALTTAGLKRLEVARCLAARPGLLILDEPLGGLNPSEVEEALGLIRKLRSDGLTIIFIEHIVPAVMAVSDRVVVIANGRKLAEGTPAEIQANAEVRRAYLGDVAGAVARHRGSPGAGSRRGAP